MTNRFSDALALRPQAVPPVWMMRQAGRYQRAYQAFRKRHSFEELCREPELSARVALASIEDFDFDAAILFSDLLFPLDAMGLGLHYDDHGPHLAKRFTAETRGNGSIPRRPSRICHSRPRPSPPRAGSCRPTRG